jgi:hypothetical protein
MQAAQREDANRLALQRLLGSEPQLIGVKPAGQVVPDLKRNMILHAAPPTTWEAMSDLLRASVLGAAIFEGMAETPQEATEKAQSGEIVLAAAQDHAAMAGGAGCITASLPVLVVEDRGTGKRAFHPVMEPFGKSLTLGMFDEEVLNRLNWIRDEFGPALDQAIQAIGGLDARALMAEALQRGDELHNRNAAATSMFVERVAPGFLQAGVSLSLARRAFEFMSGNPQFFVAVSLAVARLALDAAADVEGSSLVIAAGANGRHCGIKLSGLGDRWFVAPADVPDGIYLEGFGAQDRSAACGDSLTVECYGLGASVLAAAPALWPVLGADEDRARQLFERAARIALGRHPDYRVPLLLNDSAPAGVDAVRVVETGILPVIDIVMLHHEPGHGVIGFGLTSLPKECFEQAVGAL